MAAPAPCAAPDSVQHAAAESPRRAAPRYASREEAAAALHRDSIPLLAGLAVSADLVGPVMLTVSPYGQVEGALRANLRGRYFPCVEIGWGASNHTEENTGNHYKTSAPYFRLGADYNFARDRASGNRILGGVRYGFSSFRYDFSAPPVVDPVWGTAAPVAFTGMTSTVHWAEVSFGLEARIWGYFHIGWSFRYKFRLSQTHAPYGQAWYVPGYGRNDTSALGGTFSLLFDI